MKIDYYLLTPFIILILIEIIYFLYHSIIVIYKMIKYKKDNKNYPEVLKIFLSLYFILMLIFIIILILFAKN